MVDVVTYIRAFPNLHMPQLGAASFFPPKDDGQSLDREDRINLKFQTIQRPPKHIQVRKSSQKRQEAVRFCFASIELEAFHTSEPIWPYSLQMHHFPLLSFKNR